MRPDASAWQAQALAAHTASTVTASHAAEQAEPLQLPLVTAAPGMRPWSMQTPSDTSDFVLADAIALLSRTPAMLNALLRGMPERWTRCTEGGDSWSPCQIVGHLVHGERTDWMVRARIILEHGEAQPFSPFDRLAQFRDGETAMEQQLDTFAQLRADNLAALQSLQLDPDDLRSRGTHPALGGVTLAQLLATWTTHDLTHLHQLARVMAHPWREAVGPWSAYLGVLHCHGHGG